MRYTKEIADRGVLISEYPPGAHPDPKNFPVRNRLIAALGDGTVVTEGGSQSGALSTAHLAADFGKDVFVIPPHDITAPENQGNIELLREGAIPVYGTRDILAHNQKFVSELLAEAKRQLGKRKEIPDDFLNADSDDVPENLSELLTPEQRYAKEIAALDTDISPLKEPALTIYDIIKSSPGDFNIEILTGQLERDPDEILDILTELEMENYIFRAPDGSFF
jgi:predicted Rossmann fold nucleotide-binding protein DprA/Smf involved in DNA uptake